MPTDPNVAVNELADRFWEGVLERDPVTATILGDERYDDRLPDLGEAGRAADAAAFRETLAEAEAIGADGLDTEQVITRDMLMLVAQTHLEALDRKQYQLAVNHIFGLQTLPVQVAQYQQADTPERLERLLTRFAAYPTAVEQEIATLREGVPDGRTSAAIPVRKLIEQVERMLTLPSAEFPAVSMAQVSDAEARARVQASVEAHVYPALQRLRDFLTDEYESQARPQPGLSTTPGGDEAYELAIRMNTTVATSADEVHRFGLEDMAHIEAEKDEIARRLGKRDRAALAKALAEDAANRPTSREQIVELATRQTARAFAAAPSWFGLSLIHI